MSNDGDGKVTILCIYGSPRIRGNTDQLLDAFCEGVEAAGGVAERVYLRNLKISPCREIYACENAGKCALNDDMQPLYDRLRRVDGFALASPVMFYSVTAVAKAFIDRCQALWCLKHRRGEKISLGRLAERKGVFLSVGGSRGQKIFDGPKLTFKYFLETLDAEPWEALTYRQIDDKGDIAKHPEALDQARELGRAFVGVVAADLEGDGDG